MQLVDASFEEGASRRPACTESRRRAAASSAAPPSRPPWRSSRPAAASLSTSRGSRPTGIGIATASLGATGIPDTLIHVNAGSRRRVRPACEQPGAGASSSRWWEPATRSTGSLPPRAGGGSALLTLKNSTVTGFAHDLTASGDPISLAGIAVSYSNYGSTTVLPGGLITPGFGNHNVPPGFVDVAAGDFHLRHDSPLLDSGDDICGAGLHGPRRPAARGRQRRVRRPARRHRRLRVPAGRPGGADLRARLRDGRRALELERRRIERPRPGRRADLCMDVRRRRRCERREHLARLRGSGHVHGDSARDRSDGAGGDHDEERRDRRRARAGRAARRRLRHSGRAAGGHARSRSLRD